MKKWLLCFFVFLLFITYTTAQVRFGLKAGLNSSNLYGDDAGSSDSKLGFIGGCFLQYQSNKNFALQPELSYSMKGAKTQVGYVNFTLAYDYIEFPLLFKFILPIDNNPKIISSFFAGPFIALNAKSKIITDVAGITNEFLIEKTATAEYGAQFGGSIGLNIGKNEFGLDIRYVLGLSTIDKSINSYDIRNSVLNFNVYFVFENR
ncbi:MAG: porin family protein [Ignavibacteriaceae bacterium]